MSLDETVHACIHFHGGRSTPWILDWVLDAGLDTGLGWTRDWMLDLSDSLDYFVPVAGSAVSVARVLVLSETSIPTFFMPLC
jgi:hypothetical protein